MSEKDWWIYLAHARDCLARTEKYAAEGRDAFLLDSKTQDAILRNLEIIGQCIKDAGIDRLAAIEPSIDWRAISAFRNVLAHAYLSIAPERVWLVVANDIPPLAEAVARILASHRV